jgi:IS1 family transposase
LKHRFDLFQRYTSQFNLQNTSKYHKKSPIYRKSKEYWILKNPLEKTMRIHTCSSRTNEICEQLTGRIIKGKISDEFRVEQRSVEKSIFQKQENMTYNHHMCNQKECFILNLLL